MDEEETIINAESTNEQGTAEEETKVEVTAEELEKEREAEVDRKITQALKTQEVKFRKEQDEKERLAKLTEDEKAKELEKQRVDEISKREKALEEKESKLITVDVLVEEGLDISLKGIFPASKYIGVENKTEAIRLDVKAIKAVIDTAVTKGVEAEKAKYLQGETPNSVLTQTTKATGTVTKEQFDNFTYKEKVEIFNTNPELYSQLSKS